MRTRASIALLLPLACLLGCGSSATLPSSSSTSPNLSGDWMAIGNLDPVTHAFTSPIVEFMGALQSTNGTVTGTLRAFDDSNLLNPCVPLTQDLAVTGSVTTANSLSGTVDNLSLTVPISGGVATITATLPQNPQTFTLGNWQIVGGACAMPATPMMISQYAPATGTYSGMFNVLATGTLTPVPGTATAITAVLTQSTTPNADGQFPLTGTITATGACTAGLAFTNGIVFGGGILSHPLSGPSNPQGDFFGGMNPTATSITGLFASFTACNYQGYQGYQGTLTRQ